MRLALTFIAFDGWTMIPNEWYTKTRGESVVVKCHNLLPNGWTQVARAGSLPDRIDGPFTQGDLIQKARSCELLPQTTIRQGTDSWDRPETWLRADTFLVLVREMGIDPFSTFAFDRVQKLLSPAVKLMLQRAVGTGLVEEAPDVKTLAFMEKGMWDHQNQLTAEGQVVAISVCPLKKQCEVLGLPHQILSLPKLNKPELAVMAAVKKGECKAAHCEGGAIGLLLQCLSFDRLLPIYKAFAASYGSSDPDQSVKRMHGVTFSCPPRLLKICPDLPSQLVAEIANASEKSLLRSFDTLLAWQRHPPGYSSAIPVGCWSRAIALPSREILRRPLVRDK